MKCLECNIAMKKKAVNYHYIDSGLKNIILKNLQVMVCDKCGEEEIMIPNLEQLHRVMATVIASQEQRLLSEEVRFLRSHLGFSGVDFAKAIGVTPETISRWETGKEQMTLPHERLLRVLILYGYGPVREYHNDLFNLGARERKTKGKRFFTKTNNQWREAA